MRTTHIDRLAQQESDSRLHSVEIFFTFVSAFGGMYEFWGKGGE